MTCSNCAGRGYLIASGGYVGLACQSCYDDPMEPSRQFTVITQHGEERKVRRARFSDYDAAKAHAEAHNPETDGSMVPNVDERFVDHKAYERGFYSDHVNRYAVMHNTDLLHHG